jgi:hypothetical protein
LSSTVGKKELPSWVFDFDQLCQNSKAVSFARWPSKYQRNLYSDVLLKYIFAAVSSGNSFWFSNNLRKPFLSDEFFILK